MDSNGLTWAELAAKIAEMPQDIQNSRIGVCYNTEESHVDWSTDVWLLHSASSRYVVEENGPFLSITQTPFIWTVEQQEELDAN